MKGIFLLLLSLLFQLYSWAQEGCIHSFTEGDVVCSGQEFSFSAVPNDGANGVISEWTLNGTVVSNSATDYGSYVNNGSTDVVLEYIMVGTTLNGCVDTDTVLITVLTIPTIDLSKKDILCPNQSWMTGTIYLNGVDTIFSLLYTNDVSTTYSNSNSNDSITGLAPDDYYVYYVDTNSCESEIGEVTIIEPAPISYSVYTTIDDNCDQNTGRIQFFGLNGGTAPYSFVDTASGVNYNSGAQNSAVVELSGGNYFVDIIDANGCIKRLFSTPVEITTSNETPPIQPEVENAYSLCKGDSLMIVDTEITNEEMWHLLSFSSK